MRHLAAAVLALQVVSIAFGTAGLCVCAMPPVRSQAEDCCRNPQMQGDRDCCASGDVVTSAPRLTLYDSSPAALPPLSMTLDQNVLVGEDVPPLATERPFSPSPRIVLRI